jgi:glutamate dehydrogenase
MVKNAVIVPVGAKGGFVVKRPPADGGREALQDEVVACYSTFMRGLLDLTDNRAPDGTVVPPPEVVRYDEDDPYLVVAADKGTATFSDLANSIAAEYGFWLDDAFASGGSAGYDHKKMGITAKGAWESVRRHFLELGVDTQTTDFTVVGIGDMAGDVFGNGMLLSPHIKLVAAFNHQHIFIDPDPDPEASFAERRRLFDLPRSSWADYDGKLISEGGGIWPRTAKSIKLSPQARQALAVEAEALPPNELISALLKAPVDLLWNGGIGTYVKASRESHADAGDRTNDAVRVDCAELRCKVVGEGGNLGFTQLGRVEYALAGGRVNTDFIDNSGGVDCSDHEVNIKILLNQVLADGDLTRKQRDNLLAKMTDDVAAAVLQDNYRQVLAISVTEAQAPQLLDEHSRLIRSLERAGRLDRRLEFLPSDEQLAERRATGRGLTRPELAVLLAYSKNVVRDELFESGVPEDPYFSAELSGYFAAMLWERFGEQMEHHPPRRQIVATLLSNGMVNRVGPGFLYRLEERTGAKTPAAAQAYAAARDMFDLDGIWSAVNRLDSPRFAHLQLAMLIETRRLVEHGALWLLRNRRQPLDIAAEVKQFRAGVVTLAKQLRSLVVGAEHEAVEQRIAKLGQQGVPEELAIRLGTLEPLSAALDIIEVATKASGHDTASVAAVYFTLGSRLGLDWLSGQIVERPSESHWTQLAKASLGDELFIHRRRLAAAALRQAGENGEPAQIVDAWIQHNHGRARRCLETLGELRDADGIDIAMVCVALHELENLVQTGG